MSLEAAAASSYLLIREMEIGPCWAKCAWANTFALSPSSVRLTPEHCPGPLKSNFASNVQGAGVNQPFLSRDRQQKARSQGTFFLHIVNRKVVSARGQDRIDPTLSPGLGGWREPESGLFMVKSGD